MSFGADCLIQKINDRIAALEGCTYNAAQVSGSLNSIETYHCVPNLASLPAAACNEGRFIYVEDIKSFRYSDGYYWTKDACSVLGDVNTYSSLWTWGDNATGTLGDGTTVNRTSPGTVAGTGVDWCKISTFSSHVGAIKRDGTLWTWGCNGVGRLGDGTGTNRCSPGTIAGGGTTWCQVSFGCQQSAAIKTDGTLWTWGNNGTGRLGDGTVANRCSPGTVAGGGTTWCQVSGGYSHGGAIKTDGTLWTWGCNNIGQLGNGTTVSRCSPGTVVGDGTTWCWVSGGSNHIQAIKTDGTLWTWGGNCCGQLGDGTTVSKCSPGTVAGGGTTWCQVSSNYCSIAAIKTDGTLWTWGRNAQGRLGDGTTVDRCSPGTVAGGGTTWCQVTTACATMAAVKIDGSLWTWGLGSSGVPGVTSRSSPGTVSGLGPTWIQVSSGSAILGDFTLAIRTRGF